MNKWIVLLGCISLPAFATPPVLETDFLNQGEHMLGIGYGHVKSNGKGHLDNAVNGNIDASFSEDLLTLEYGLGFTAHQMLTLSIPYTIRNSFDERIDWTDNTTAKFKSSNEGLGDLTVEYRHLLKNTESYRIAGLFAARIPLGDDDTGESEIIEDGIKTQSLKKGGAGNGRTDFGLGLSFSSVLEKDILFLEVNYQLNGSKTEEGEKEEPGDDALLEIGVLHTLNEKSRIGASLAYIYTREGKSGNVDVSSYSVYGGSLVYIYNATKSLIIFPKLIYLKSSEQKNTDRTDGTVFKYSELDAAAFSIEIIKTF